MRTRTTRPSLPRPSRPRRGSVACGVAPRRARRLEGPCAFDYRSRMSESVLPHWTLRCDGGSRGNPGAGALGYVLLDPRSREVEARGEALGVVTNNVAEYRALIAGLEAAARHGIDRLVVCMDSELVV